MPNWIGDAVMATPALIALKRIFPEAAITVLIKPWAASIIKSHPVVDNVIEYDIDSSLSLGQRLKLVSRIKSESFDLGLLFTNSFDSALTLWLAGIKNIIGYKTDARQFLLNTPFPIPATRGQIHEVYYYLELVKKTGEKLLAEKLDNSIFEEQPFLKIVSEKDAQDVADKIIKDSVHGIKGEKRTLIGFNPGAAYGPAKCWPVEKFQKLGQKIKIKWPNATIFIFGTAKEKETGDMICQSTDNCINLAGITTLAEAIALIERLDLLVTNDSGLMHVGAGLQVPLVAIFGSTNPVTTGPWSDHSVVVRNDIKCSPCLKRKCPLDTFECMNSIDVDTVYEACERVLHKER